MPAATDRRPAIVVVCDDDSKRAWIAQNLERWFANDYEIHGIDTAPELMKLATRLRDGGTDVALVIAEQNMQSEPGTVVLGQIRDILPTTRRVVLVGWENASTSPAITRASLLGDVDHAVGWPWSVSDEQFLARIGDLLADWATEHGRYVEAAKLVAEPEDAEAQELRDTVIRWAVPLGFYDTRSPLGQRLADELPNGWRLPALFLPGGRVLSRPTVGDVANAFGANADLSERFDVAIVGSGPAGLAAAVYGVSEGLRTLIIEADALGGQAGASPQIRNYLGFPGGISGSELMVRALQQAWAFGTEMLIGRSAVELGDVDGELEIALDDGSKARARSVVLAMGVRYRKIGVPSVERLLGRGVFYGSGAIEAPGVGGEEVFVVGGGNSGAQAAINLARYARHVGLVVRDGSLESVSDYLVEQLRGRSNIEILLNTEIAEARGGGRLRSLVLRDKGAGELIERDAFALFILIGATPHTDWLPAAIERDERGFILTGDDVDQAAGDRRPILGTSMPGIYAVGDVRHGSIKRVAAAVGEGATAIREIHDYLAEAREETVALAGAR